MEPHAEDERVRSEPEIQHLEGDGKEAANIDDDEVEELHNSLREIVQDPSVKPKLQCLMVDPSFSMVTVQSEDSGIVWETASSRCSTPWASEASSPSDAYSMEGSGTQGNIVIIMDEDNIKRRRRTSSKGKLSDRFRRRLSGAAIGEERPAMAEVSVPNIRPETSEDGQSSESKADKDQDFFNLISEGFEILNIVVPSKLPTVDEEDSTEMVENLSYLEKTPQIKSKCKPPEGTDSITSPDDLDIDSQETKDESQKDASQTTEGLKKEETNLDYLEKFTLLDENAPADVSEKLEQVEEQEVDQPEEPQVPQEKEKVEEKLEDSFVIISDVEISAEHLDEAFYGAKCHEEPSLPSHHKGDGKHLERQSSRTLKECGSTLFGSQESILIPIYLPSGPPKIIDQDLLDEPRAMSFHYSDLYEDAIGDRKKEDEFSDAESIVSEKSFKRRFSDSDDGDGYLEKFILKDDVTEVEDAPEEDLAESDRMIWPQNKFEMTGCLIRVKEESAPQEEDCSVSESKLEVTNDATEKQIPPTVSSEDCEDCGEGNTGCVRVKSVSESLEERGNCGTKTGCAEAEVISHDKLSPKSAGVVERLTQETDKSLLIEDKKQNKVEIKNERKQVPANVAQEKVPKMKDRPKVLSVQQEHEKTENTSSEINENAFHDGLGETHKVTDSKVEIEETVVITKKEVSDKGQQHKNETEEKTESILATKTHLKDTPKAEKTQILPLENIVQKEPPVVEKELTVAPEQHEDEKIKPSSEKAVVPKPGCEIEATVASLPSKSEVLEKKQPEEEVREQSKVQEQVTDLTDVQKLEAHVSTVSSETKVITEAKSELETVKASEELVAREKDAAEKKDEEVVEVKEEIKKERMEEMVPTVECEVPAVDSVTLETVETVSAIESLNDATQCVPTNEKFVLVEKPNKMAIDVDLKHEPPRSGDDEILQKKSEIREVEGDVVSAVALPQDLAVAPPTVPEVPEDKLLPAVVLPPVLDKHELSDAVLKDAHAETEKEHYETISPVPAEKTEDLSKVSVSPPIPNEVHKQEGSEIRDVAAVEITIQESIDQLPEKVPVAVAEEVSTEIPTSELEAKVEAKSKKVLLKDTHKENIWRTLEPTTPPPPPVEIQDSSMMRVSPLEQPEHIRDDEDVVVAGKLKRDSGLFSTLRSFTPHEDLSGFGCDKTEPGLNRESVEELDYEMITKQDAKQLGTEVIAGKEGSQEIDYAPHQSTEQTIEAGYEFIEDFEGTETPEPGCLIEEAEIQPMDAFCLVCRCPILMSDDGHQNHEVASLDKAFEDIKNQLGNFISGLQERSENIEDMVSELELAYNTVEDQCKDGEKALDEQKEEMLKLVMDQYNEMSQAMEDEKKVKLEQLYDQIVSFQANIDSAKETMEKAKQEIEEMDESTIVSSYKDIESRLKTALESTMSLELGPRGLLVFEDYAKGTTGNGKKNRQAIAVPQQPHLQPQEANSATCTSVTVYWTINDEDIIDCFQVYCMEEPQGAISEEYRVTVKESYCNLEELEPDKCYKVWVMAVNYTGCSLPSERLPFRTAPSVPVIHPEACTVLWDSATLRWSSAQPSAVDSFTLEYCRQYAMEGEGLRSVSGIKGCEHKVLLQPNENFLFYIKSVNAAGASEQSEAALISTRGTRFHLLSETANSVLKVSEDRNSVQYPLETYNQMSSLVECPAVMGELLPRVGYHYWETVVAGCKAYRIGVAYQTAPQNSTVGDNGASWCLHCVPTSISCRFELLHETVESDIFVMDVPARIGTLLDFMQGRLVFFNAQNGQCLGSFKQRFNQPCHPVFVLEKPGSLELKMTMEVPEFAKHW